MSDPPPATSRRKLLVLDLDETLVHASTTALDVAEDFRVGPYFVYRRPHLDRFVETVAAHYDLAVWTSSGSGYAREVIERIFPEGALAFAWSSRRCTLALDWTTGDFTSIKNLAKLKRLGYRLESVIVVDDTPSKHVRNYGNLVAVSEFVGDATDAELPVLARYLVELAQVANVRTIEKRHWREQARQADEGCAPPRA